MIDDTASMGPMHASCAHCQDCSAGHAVLPDSLLCGILLCQMWVCKGPLVCAFKLQCPADLRLCRSSSSKLQPGLHPAGGKAAHCSTSMTCQVMVWRVLQSCCRCALQTVQAFAGFCTLQVLVGLQVDSAETNMPHCLSWRCWHPAQQFACRWQSDPPMCHRGWASQTWHGLPCTCAPQCWATCRWWRCGMTAPVVS